MRLKNLLNVIFLYDNKILLFPDIEIKEDPFFEELEINLKKVRRIKNEILRAEQRRQSKNF